MVRLFAVLALIAAAQLDAQPAATVIVRGRIVAREDTARPLRGARVRVTSHPDLPTVFSDGEGQFAVAVSPPFRLEVTKAGYAPVVAEGGGASPDGIQIAMMRGAVLTGVIVDEEGDGVPDASVRAPLVAPLDRTGTSGAIDRVVDTDERGRFRIGSLPPGRYEVHSLRRMRRNMDLPELAGPAGEIRRLTLPQTLAAGLAPLSDGVRVDVGAEKEAFITLRHTVRGVVPPDAPTAGFVSGVVIDQFGEPLEDVSVRLLPIRFVANRQVAGLATVIARTDDRGIYRAPFVAPGRYLVEAAVEDPGYARVFYPGVTTVANAVPITVSRSEDAGGVTIAFTRSAEARVFGFAIGADGQPLRGGVSLTLSAASTPIALPRRMADVDETGVFEFLNVPPGEYVLSGPVGLVMAGGPVSEKTEYEFASQIVRVERADMPPITLTASPTATLSGRVVLEPPVEGLTAGSLQIIARPAGDVGPDSYMTAVVAEDGTFAMRGLAGSVRFALRNGRSWWLKSVDVDGINAVETPVTFRGRESSRSDVRVVVSTRAAAITGRVTDDRDEPVDGFRHVVFAVDRTRWYWPSPYVRVSTGPDASGGFTVEGLPPGDYWVAAVQAFDAAAVTAEGVNPELLERLQPTATRVSLGEGERAAVTLRLPQ